MREEERGAGGGTGVGKADRTKVAGRWGKGGRKDRGNDREGTSENKGENVDHSPQSKA